MGNVDIQVGQIVAYSEGERQELAQLCEELQHALREKGPNVAMLVLRMFKVTRGAIMRSHPPRLKTR